MQIKKSIPLTMLCLFVLSMVWHACRKDLLEEDISSATLNLLAPTDNAQFNTSAVTFWWDTIGGATHYRLQIVTHDFSNIQQLILETTTAANKYDYSLPSGTYQWRIRAENGSSMTSYITRTLIIDSGVVYVDITPPSSPGLVSPSNLDTLADTTVLFVWNRDTSAIADSLYLYNPDSGTLVSGFPIYTNDQNYSFDADTSETYYWKLKSGDAAENWSGFSSLRSFFVQ